MGSHGRRGQIIFLNGTSSSGKSSIAGQLLLMLDPPHFHMSVDAINSMRAKQKTRELDDAGLEAVLARTRAGFHRAVAGMAGYRVVFVGVRCSPAELERRERERGDRPSGVALAQQAQVHAHGLYDIECDTTAASPYDCAVRVRDFLGTRQVPTAFDRLRALLLDREKTKP